MFSPTRRQARLLSLVAIPVAIVAGTATIATTSYSAFKSTTSNPTDSWASGSVALSDDDANTAMFTAANLKPGSTGTKCIAVTSSGTLPSTVRLYGTSATTTNSFSSYLNISITQGTGGGFGSCTGFTALGTGANVYTGTLAGFATASTNFSNGAGSWAPTGTGSEVRVFQFTYTVDAATPDTAQGSSAALGFTWEAQNS